MKKKIFLIVIFLFLLTIIVVLKNYSEKKQGRVCFESYCFNVELAVTPEQRRNGLMFRENLGPKEGMLFVYDKEEMYYFWMKNTLISLDIIWINNNKEVVFISENVQPCKNVSCPAIKPSENAKYILEINGGICQKIGLAIGDKISIEY